MGLVHEKALFKQEEEQADDPNIKQNKKEGLEQKMSRK